MVDRASELAELASKNIVNHQQGGALVVDHQRVSLITAGQLFGAGKSFLGRAAPSNLAKNDEAMKLLRMKHNDEEMIQCYLKALCISIDLQKRGILGDKTEKGVELFLAMALYDSFPNKPTIEEVFPLQSWNTITLSKIVLYCRQSLEKDKYIYIHWDEVMSNFFRTPFFFFFFHSTLTLSPLCRYHNSSQRMIRVTISSPFFGGASPNFYGTSNSRCSCLLPTRHQCFLWSI
jgi:hypothetical protein